MTSALLLSAAAMTAIVAIRYLIVSGGFAWATRRRVPGLYAGLDPQIRREIGWSLASRGFWNKCEQCGCRHRSEPYLIAAGRAVIGAH